MKNRMHLFFIVVLASFFNVGNACTMEGVSVWAVLIEDPFRDVDTGVIRSRWTSNVDGITVREFGGGLAGGPYVNVEHTANQFIISTNENYSQFEHNEISDEISVTVDFACTGGGQQSLVIIINIIDTNNNSPEFLPIPTDVYEFIVTPPLRPGYLLTGCMNDLIVRDIDLTTYRIDFAIQDNPYIKIEFDEAGSADIHRKEFKAILSTTSLIRTLEEPLELWISATDVDETGNEPRTTRATLRIVADTEFVFPQEPIFSQTFYLADYTKDHQFNLFETIYLRQGYDAYVNFTLEGEHHTHFETSSTNNEVFIDSLNTLPLEDISENQIHLVLRAQREYTSGDTATVIIRLPEATPLNFEKPLYEGKIVDGNLDVPSLILSQGYENKIVTAEVVGEYSTYFAASVEGNLVTVAARGDIENIIGSNNFITFPVKALTDDSESTTVLSLDVIKDDNVTPVFDKPIYNLDYDPDSGLSNEQIVFVQGFDATVTTDLLGEHERYFDINRSVTGVITITRTAIEIPDEIFNEQSIILSIKASKARTVGANAAIIIRLPEGSYSMTPPFLVPCWTISNNSVPDELFSKVLYEGVLENDIVSHEAITLTGYSGTEVELFGAYSALFEAILSNGAVTVTAKPSSDLPEDVTHLTLELRAGTARTVVLLNIKTEDIPIESFSKILFEGHIRNGALSHEAITLSDYSGTEVELFGEYSSLFEAVLSNEAVTVTARSPPLTLPEGLTHLTLELNAGTVKSVLLINVETIETPGESFSKIIYEGYIRDDIASHETITLSGYSGTEVELFGEHSSLFEAVLADNAVTVTTRSSVTLPIGLIHLSLELHAGIARAVLLLNFESDDTPPESNESFSKLLFEGVIRNDVVSHESIILSEYSGTEVGLLGEYSALFEAVLANNAVTINRRSSVTVPAGLTHITLELQAGTARAVLVLNIENDDTPPESNDSFSKVLFEGIIRNDVVSHESITLSDYSGTAVELLGEYSALFEAVLANNAVTVNTRSSVTIPAGLTHITLELQAGTARAVLVLNIENDDTPPESNESFSKVLFEGFIRHDVVSHESITLSQYSGTEVELFGEHSSLFEAVLDNNAVTVNVRTSVTLPAGLNQLTLELRAGTARAVLLLNIENTDIPPESSESFSKALFEGVLRDDVVSHESITLSGYSGTEVELLGEYSILFEAVLNSNSVTVTTRSSVTIPTGLTHITLELQAGTARSILLLNVDNAGSPPESNESFSKVIFEGVLSNGVVSHEAISLFGYSGTEVELFGDHSSLFEAVLSNNAVTVNIRPSVSLPTGLNHLTLELHAGIARAVLLLNIENDDTAPISNESFSKVLFEGILRDNVVSHESITLSGYSGEVELLGEYSLLFEAVLDSNTVTVNTRSSVTIPTGLTHITLELRAGTARSVLLLNIDNTGSPPESNESFSKVLFEGVLSNGVVSHEAITLFGYSGTKVELFGEYSTLFEAILTNNEVNVNARPSVILPTGLNHLTLELRAGIARAVLLLDIENIDPPPESNELFSEVLFKGIIRNNIVSHDLITLSGYSGTEVELLGEYSTLFEAELNTNEVTVNTRSSVTIPAELTHITLELRAGTARAVLILDIENTDPPPESNELFSEVLFKGTIRNNIVSHDLITLSGYSGTEVELLGEYSTLFEAELNTNEVTVNTRSSVTIPAELTHITLELRAGTARAVLLLDIENTGTSVESNESFNKVLFEGVIRNDIVSHESITLSDYSGSEVQIFGEYESLFKAELTNNIVTVSAKSPPLTLPEGLTHLTLELQAGTARSVLLLNIENTDAPVIPVVTFSSESYTIRVDITQTGLVGQVRATADNGEPINYSLQLDILHLGQRLSINNAGELHLSAPISGGLYAFRVVGTTAFTEAVGTATIHLTVEAVTVCGDDLVMPPLITLERVEEEPHHDLLSETQYEGCHFSIANRWPLDQNWLYVNETGLHTRAIDREHESIAFMTLSQVQVEITLHCDNDNTRVKRSLNPASLVSYDYGPNKWILTDSIPAYNSRRTLLNLIVNDINDNDPIFDEKPNEPIAVGYPIPELEAIVLPRSLTQLHATDADIGENAAIVYSSPNPELAVSPITGFVHVRNGARLEQNAAITVHATDRNGQGNRGSIELIVKLLDQSNIAVVTVQDAFLDDEASVLSYLSDAVGYDVRVLRSVVVSQEEENDDNRRIKRETTVSGASLELYIYGLRDRDPVNVGVLTTDISNAASTITVNVANIVSLEDHLEGLEICAIMGRDTGLLVATIVLSVLLFVVIVLIAIWSFLKWRKNTYQKFEDTNSLASRVDSLDSIPKPEFLPKARINPDELMKSERRLQEILDAPVEAITVEPIPALKSLPVTSNLIELPPQEPSSPIVIQSIDKLKDGDDMSDDEFGELKQPRRKSVVTFNENVEKIIHVEDNEDSEDVASDPDLEVYKF